jgi:hypothetical protein
MHLFNPAKGFPMKKIILQVLMLSSLVWMGIACTENSTTTGPAAPTATATPGLTVTPVTLTFLYTTYISTNFNGNTGQTCAQCHNGPNAQGVHIDASSPSNFYNSIVSPSTVVDGCASTYVVANSTTQSALYLRLSSSCGSPANQMPLGETPLNATQLAQVASWINSGAPNN